jgi:putative endonuclease
LTLAKSEKIKAYERGARLEKLAALYLQIKGYKILKIRYKTPMGEIDIVARRKNTLVFVEVKGRGQLTNALESVTLRNRARVEQAARHFIAAHPQFINFDMRFDAVVFAPPFTFRHLDNAWRARS